MASGTETTMAETEARGGGVSGVAGGQAPAGAKVKPRALGRGLESLLPAVPRPAIAKVDLQGQVARDLRSPVGEASAESSASSLSQEAAARPGSGEGAPSRILPIELIDLNPRQTRRRLDPETFAEFKRSVETGGVLLPITVRPVAEGRFEITSGQRRFTAAKELGHKTVHVVVKAQTDEEAFVTTIVENLQREDLSPLDQAYAFQRLQQEFGYTQDEISKQVGKDRSTVTNFLSLLNLPKDLQEALDESKLSMGHAKALLGLRGKEMMSQVGHRAGLEGWSVRRTEKEVGALLHGAAPRVERPAAPMDPNVRAAQEQLQAALGLKVTVEDNRGRGRVIIEYSSVDDFDVLMGSFGQRK